jgi:hypothetical protein
VPCHQPHTLGREGFDCRLHGCISVSKNQIQLSCADSGQEGRVIIACVHNVCFVHLHFNFYLLGKILQVSCTVVSLVVSVTWHEACDTVFVFTQVAEILTWGELCEVAVLNMHAS